MNGYLKEQIEWFKSFFTDDSGKPSSRKIIELGVAWSLIASYIKVAYLTQNMPFDGSTWVVAIALILGLKTADYYFKSRSESGSGSKP